MARLRRDDWRTELIYLALPNVEMSRQRVAERVAHGGHAIAETDIARRFPRSLHNLLATYAPAVHQTRCFMNGDAKPELVFEQQGPQCIVHHAEHFAHLMKEAGL